MASEITTYRDLIAWQKAFEFGLQIYESTRSFPREERYGLTSQMRRAAVAIASNIAEGYGRERTAEYLRFLRITRGSIDELDTQSLFARKLGHIDWATRQRLHRQLDDISKVLGGLIRSIEQKPNA